MKRVLTTVTMALIALVVTVAPNAGTRVGAADLGAGTRVGAVSDSAGVGNGIDGTRVGR